MKALSKEEFTHLVNNSRAVRSDQKPVCDGHIMSLYDDSISNRQEVNRWAQELGCTIEVYSAHSVITIVPLPKIP
jgi:hypothetical protein